ncbi:MAG: DNA repair protein RecO [Ruminococcaceae bacterium]|nr:DNA repair protein RecO [Oscillospiraceae bacterium]
MSFITTDGLVLRDTKLNDKDSLLTVLTRDYGKLTLKAWGVRGKSGKLRAPCQLFAYSEFTASEYRGYYSIKEAELKEQFGGIRSDIELLSLASYIAQVTESVADEDSPTPELLSLALNSLYALSELKKPQMLVKAAFELKLMSIEGYEPQLDGCVGCDSAEPVWFNLTDGALYCADCGGTGVEINDRCFAAMRHIVLGDSKRIFSFSLDEASLKLLAQAAEGYILTQLERGFSALDFYKTIMI